MKKISIFFIEIIALFVMFSISLLPIVGYLILTATHITQDSPAKTFIVLLVSFVWVIILNAILEIFMKEEN